MLLSWSPWFKYRFIKIDLVTIGKFYFNFSCVLGGVVDCINVNHGLHDEQNVRALTKVDHFSCVKNYKTLVIIITQTNSYHL